MPSIFVDTYQLYKKQTNQLAQWLLNTAVHCGYSFEESPSTSRDAELAREGNNPAAPAGGKGKRGNLAANVRGDSKSTEGVRAQKIEESPHSIRLSQFLKLARSIAEKARDNFTILATIPQLILQIIKMRKSVSLYYKMQSRSRPDDSRLRGNNKKHKFFIKTLEKVLEMLQKVAEPLANAAKIPHKQDEDDSVESLNNRFSALEVEEPIDIEVDTNTPTPLEQSGKYKPGQKRDVIYDSSEQEEEEIDFAVFCLFEDLRRIRTHLNQIWQDYKSGELDLMTASVITNTAFGSAQNIDAAFCQAYPSLLSSQFHDNPIMPMYILNCLGAGADLNYRERPGDIYNYEMQEIGKFFYLPVYLLLESFSRVLKPGYIPLAKKGHFGIYNPKSKREKMSYRQKSMWIP